MMNEFNTTITSVTFIVYKDYSKLIITPDNFTFNKITNRA